MHFLLFNNIFGSDRSFKDKLKKVAQSLSGRVFSVIFAVRPHRGLHSVSNTDSISAWVLQGVSIRCSGLLVLS